jgi:hypothetical protein
LDSTDLLPVKFGNIVVRVAYLGKKVVFLPFSPVEELKNFKPGNT